MSGLSMPTLLDQLVQRDLEILSSLDQFRLLTTKQVQRLHFDPTHLTTRASARACHRALVRLRDLGVVQPLGRRIGGVRAGSAGFAWYVGAAGERVLHHMAERPHNTRTRRNYREPGRQFVDHTLAVGELAVTIIEAGRTGGFTTLSLRAEPASWQRSLSVHGATQTLKPDLHLISAAGDFEHHWFIEVDLSTEHLPVLIRQCLAYQAHRLSGRYQAAHELYPAVVWVVETAHRKQQLEAGIRAETQLDDRLFTVVRGDEALMLLQGVTKAAERSDEGKNGDTAP